MRILEYQGGFEVVAGTYSVRFMPERLLALLRVGKDFYYGMNLLSAVDCIDCIDETVEFPEILRPEIKGDEVWVTIRSRSTLWEEKKHYYVFAEDAIGYWTKVRGQGKVERAYFFRGNIQKNEVASVPGFTQVFCPMPNFQEKQEFHVAEYISIGVGNDERVFGSVRGYGLHGAPLCFVMHEGDRGAFVSAGVLAKAGEYGFDFFEINHLSDPMRKNCSEPIIGTQAFSLAYNGHLQVDGEWETPKLMLQFSDERFAAVEKYVRKLEEYGGTVKREEGYHDWTFEPVFCTWHEQVARALQESQVTTLSFRQAESSDIYFRLCSQANCEAWLGRLLENGLKPGVIIIDAMWQVDQGDPAVDENKFPDLRGFIDACHEKGIKVILWYNAWVREGVPDSECLTKEGLPFKTDPTNPAFQARVKRYMHRMLSEESGCYHADGLKVDGMTATPVGSGIKTCGDVYGFELARVLLELLFKNARVVNPAAVIGQFTGFPYFGDLCDMARTGDLYTVKGDPNTANRFRAKIQNIVMPGCPVDTDGALRFNYVLPNEEVLAVQGEIGVLCLYQTVFLTQRRDFCIPVIRKLDEADYAMIRKNWKSHRPDLG